MGDLERKIVWKKSCEIPSNFLQNPRLQVVGRGPRGKFYLTSSSQVCTGPSRETHGESEGKLGRRRRAPKGKLRKRCATGAQGQKIPGSLVEEFKMIETERQEFL